MPIIGVVITVPEPWGPRLQDYRRSLGDPAADLIPTHITLIPPTEVDEAGLDRVREHLAAVAGKHHGFRVHLRGTGTFRPVSPVVFVTVAEGIGECEQLAAALRAELLDVDLRFPYHPHVTVAHVADDALLDRAFDELVDVDSVFVVEHFQLYVQHGEGPWQLDGDVALLPAAPSVTGAHPA